MTPVASLPAAGRDLDALVAENVFGAEWGPLEENEVSPPGCVARLRLRYLVFGERFDTGRPDLFFGSLSPYSTDIAAAWEVVEKLNEQERWPIIQFGPSEGGDAVQWCVQLVNPANIEANADTAPEAICIAALRAALKAVAT